MKAQRPTWFELWPNQQFYYLYIFGKLIINYQFQMAASVLLLNTFVTHNPHHWLFIQHKPNETSLTAPNNTIEFVLLINAEFELVM